MNRGRHGASSPVLRTWRVLELDRVLSAVGGRAASPGGRSRVEALRPMSREDAARELERVEAVRERLADGEFPGVPAIPDVAEDLDQLRVEGSVLTGPALWRIGVLLASGRRLQGDLPPEPGPLTSLRDLLLRDSGQERSIESTVDPDGTVKDGASRDLGRIRKEIRSVQSGLVRSLERTISELPDRYRVEDASVTLRNGRYVIPLRREGRSSVGGIVHDQSATGATLFVEPPGQVEKMNRLRGLELREAREVHRVLSDRTADLRPLGPALRGSLDALVDFDSLHARARAADAWGGSVPRLSDPTEDPLHIVDGRHPLLVERGVEVVPFTLSIESGERVIVVSGPNTGGKSVLLKTIGLVPALALSGVVPPVGPGTVVPAFTEFYADIGDEQSIQDDLSTFSAHVSHLRTILHGAGPESIVLLDELGTGTDPSEGAALATAALEHLRDRGALTVATSHLGQLKKLDQPGSGFVNASLQFDADRLEPTYRLVKGRPGRSFGLAIGRSLDLPGAVMERAGELLEEDEARQDVLLESLEREERKAKELADALEREHRDAVELKSTLAAREAALDARERQSTERAHDEARKILMDARAVVEEAISEGRQAAGDAEAERRARRAVEEEARRQGGASRPKGRVSGSKSRTPSSGMPEPGTRVSVSSGARGTVVDADGDSALVELDGGVRMRIATDALSSVGPEKTARKGTVNWIPSTGDASTEVDLRGLRIDEVEGPLLGALDRAVLADLPSLRIIHGKGTGAVKARVLELIGEDPRIEDFAPGGEAQGGTGVTVVRLR